MSYLKRISYYFVVWRLLLFLPLIFASSFIHPREGFRFVDFFPGFNNFFDNHLLVWGNFDGARYVSIATNGYVTEAAFFPLYSIIISLANVNIHLTFLWAFLVSNGAFLLALVVFYKLINLDYSSKIAQNSIVYLLVFPTAFFFGSVYSESLFLLLLFGAFYYARKGEWLTASVLGALLSLTRIIGIFILPALLVELYLQRQRVKKVYLKVFQLLLIPIGFVSYSLFNYLKWGDWLYFLKAHGELGNSRSIDSIVLLPQTVFRYLKILTSLSSAQFEWWIALLEVLAFLFGGFILYLAFRHKVRLSYLTFGMLAFLLPASSGTFSGLPRYLLILFPMFIALAMVKHKFLRVLYLISGIVLQVLLLMFFSSGYFIS